MFGIQFQGADGEGVKFKDLSGNFYGSTETASADNILVWLSDGYHTYYYGDWGDPSTGWDDKWYNDTTGEDASEETIDAGTACWYLRRSDADAALTVSGQVKLTSTMTTILANDYTMFSNPYPTAITFADLIVSDAYGSTETASADNILVWLSDGYHTYYYGDWDDPSTGWDDKWYNDTTGEDASLEEIPVGAACWYLRRTDKATTISFTSPVAK